MSSKHYALAMGIGAALGAGVALLYAPQSGVQTRKKIKRSAEDASEYLEDAAGYLKKQAEYLSDEAERLVKRTRNNVEYAIDHAGGIVTGAVKTASRLV